MNADWTPFWAILAAVVVVGGLYWWAHRTSRKDTMPGTLDEFRERRRDEINRMEQERRGSNGAA